MHWPKSGYQGHPWSNCLGRVHWPACQTGLTSQTAQDQFVVEKPSDVYGPAQAMANDDAVPVEAKLATV
jgi:hypothetical protein